jgi:hypothetical protein
MGRQILCATKLVTGNKKKFPKKSPAIQKSFLPLPPDK